MNIAYILNVKDNLLSSAVWLARFVKAKFALSGVKAEETISRKRLFFVRGQFEDIPVIRDSTLHVLNKEYDAPKIHTAFLEYPGFLT